MNSVSRIDPQQLLTLATKYSGTLPSRLTRQRRMVKANMSRYMRRVDEDSLIDGHVEQHREHGDAQKRQQNYK